MRSTLVGALLLLLPVVSSFLASTRRHTVASRRQQPRDAAFAPRRAPRRATAAASPVLMMVEVECDVVIVGGGPAGCTCALYTSRADLKTVILDKNPSVGALAITSHIANYPGVDKAMGGEELLDLMREQAIECVVPRGAAAASSPPPV